MAEPSSISGLHGHVKPDIVHLKPARDVKVGVKVGVKTEGKLDGVPDIDSSVEHRARSMDHDAGPREIAALEPEDRESGARLTNQPRPEPEASVRSKGEAKTASPRESAISPAPLIHRHADVSITTFTASIAATGYGQYQPVSVEEALSGTVPAISRHPRKVPDFWWSCLPTTAGSFAVTVVLITPEKAQDGPTLPPYRPFCILTKRELPLPQRGEFPIYHDGVKMRVVLRSAQPIQLSHEKLQLVHKASLKVIRQSVSHPLTSNVADTPYLILPLTVQASSDLDDALLRQGRYGEGTHRHPLNVTGHIAWSEVSNYGGNVKPPLFDIDSPHRLEDQARDAYVTCPAGEFSRRYKIKAVRTDLHPLSTPNDIQIQVSSCKLYFVPSH
jgi:hypothetical protein